MNFLEAIGFDTVKVSHILKEIHVWNYLSFTVSLQDGCIMLCYL